MGGGGLGYDKKSCGAYVLSNFNLTKGEKLYVLVGQPGGKMCSEVSLIIKFDFQNVVWILNFHNELTASMFKSGPICVNEKAMFERSWLYISTWFCSQSEGNFSVSNFF